MKRTVPKRGTELRQQHGMKRAKKRQRTKPGPWRSKAYLDFVRAMGCIFCQCPAEAAHVRYGDLEQGKPPTPMGQKPADNYALPLCAECHRTGPDAQHKSNERAWWARREVNPIALARALYEAYPDYEKGCAILRRIQEARER